MSQEKQVMSAVLACVAIFLLYDLYIRTRYPDYGRTPPRQEVAATSKGAANGSAKGSAQDARGRGAAGEATSPSGGSSAGEAAPPVDASEDAYEALDAQSLTFENPQVRWEVDQMTGGFRSVVLRDYQDRAGPKGEPLELVRGSMAIQPVLDSRTRLAKRGFKAERRDSSLRLSRRQGPWEVTQTLSFPNEGYGVAVDVEIRNADEASRELTAGLLMHETLPIEGDEKGSFFVPFTRARSLVLGIDGSRDSEGLTDYCEDTETRSAALSAERSQVDFIGLDLHYFLQVIQPMFPKLDAVATKVGLTDHVCEVSFVTFQDQGRIGPGESVTMAYQAYFGPKDLGILRSMGESFTATLDLGIFGFIAKPLLLAMRWINSVTHNYGVAIILLTVALKILFYPLTRQAAVSMHKMKKLNPQMQKIRERHKEDPAMQQQELMKFMREHRINPAKGCLPILPQIPVFFAFYQVLSQSIEMRHAPFFAWLQDLSAQDPYYITPVLMGGMMFVQQKITPQAGMDKNQQRIMMMMPLIFGFMMLTLPSGLVLYMVTNTVITIGQQHWLNRRLGPAT